MDWVVVVPVKPAAEGKTRLAGLLCPSERAALARAMALDTIQAAAATPGVARVLVVTSDDELEAAVPFVVDDPGGGLNAAVRAGLAAATGTVAVLLGDLPALRPDDLHAALVLAERHPRAFVADADGTGTTLLTGLTAFTPQFGTGSAALHEASGHVRLDIPSGSTLRRDVDLPADVTAVERLGVGSRTAAALSRMGLGSGSTVDQG
ncbi:2-phospho-L-lactate guanylyltransferase [Cellulomonas sp. URHD0024]|uniref:2-phospho-L-lactate guanylyltransferase n=1 Tax=Cellulomonas sp. URHD0024 TaxID=1302620 RepID=UPI0003F87119|nr:2-phospho-L-lactate guanylyltransferase [Cellulomonas sp. URHD0024]